MLPHFETAEERELRLKHEKEVEEFGKVAVEFSLACPDPRSETIKSQCNCLCLVLLGRNIYYTALPEDESVLEITHRVSLDSTEQSEQQEGPTFVGRRTPTPINKRPKSAQKTQLKASKPGKAASKRRSKRHVAEKTPILQMTLQGKSPDPHPRRIEIQSSPSRLQKELSSDSACRQASPRDLFAETDEQRLRPCWTSPTPSKLSFKQSAKEISRKLSPAQRKKLAKEEQLLPSKSVVQPFLNTVRMQMSGMSGKPYAYGSGLPENQTSYLTITAQTTF